MPIKKAAVKHHRQSRKRHLRNLDIKSELKTLTKKFQTFLSAKQWPDAQTALRLLMQKLDSASSKGALHHRTAARRKSRLTRRLAALAKR